MLAGKEGLGKFANTLASTLGFGAKRANVAGRAGARRDAVGRARRAVTGRDWGILRLLAARRSPGRSSLLALAKLLRRGSRFLTRDPRRLAGACRKELRDFLLDQGVDVPASATLRELAGLVESEFRRRGGRVRPARDRRTVRPGRRRARGGSRDAARPAGAAPRACGAR